eukprot:8998418-Prorocentrum_lima.AAC.1
MGTAHFPPPVAGTVKSGGGNDRRPEEDRRSYLQGPRCNATNVVAACEMMCQRGWGVSHGVTWLRPQTSRRDIDAYLLSHGHRQ